MLLADAAGADAVRKTIAMDVVHVCNIKCAFGLVNYYLCMFIFVFLFVNTAATVYWYGILEFNVSLDTV